MSVAIAGNAANGGGGVYAFNAWMLSLEGVAFLDNAAVGVVGMVDARWV
jgi:hypothetical protein